MIDFSINFTADLAIYPTWLIIHLMIVEAAVERPRRTMQEREDLSVLRIKQAMLSGETRIHAVTRLDHKEIDKLQDLEEGIKFKHDHKIKINLDTGEFFVGRWGDVAIVEDPETKKLKAKNSEQFVNLNTSVTIPNPERMPKGKHGKQHIYMKPKGLEEGIRLGLHQLAAADPSNIAGELQELFRFNNFIEEFKSAINQEQLTREILQQFHEQGLELISETSFANARNATKKNIAEMTFKATTTDVIDRPNKLATLTRLSSAVRSMTERELANRFIREKSANTVGALIKERNKTRFHLGKAESELSNIEEHLGFDLDPLELGKIRSRIRKVTTTPLTMARLNPYLTPRRVAEILLVGCPEDKKELIRKTMDPELADQLFSLAPAVFLLGNEDPEEAGFNSIGDVGRIAEARKRVNLARTIIRESLDKEENNNLTPSEKKPKKGKEPTTSKQESTNGAEPLQGGDIYPASDLSI